MTENDKPMTITLNRRTLVVIGSVLALVLVLVVAIATSRNTPGPPEDPRGANFEDACGVGRSALDWSYGVGEPGPDGWVRVPYVSATGNHIAYFWPDGRVYSCG